MAKSVFLDLVVQHLTIFKMLDFSQKEFTEIRTNMILKLGRNERSVWNRSPRYGCPIAIVDLTLQLFSARIGALSLHWSSLAEAIIREVSAINIWWVCNKNHRFFTKMCIRQKRTKRPNARYVSANLCCLWLCVFKSWFSKHLSWLIFWNAKFIYFILNNYNIINKNLK